MTTKRLRIFAGGVLAGGLLLGSAGLVAAANPTASPSANPTGPTMPSSGWAGMMGGSGMMGPARRRGLPGHDQAP